MKKDDEREAFLCEQLAQHLERLKAGRQPSLEEILHMERTFKDAIAAADDDGWTLALQAAFAELKQAIPGFGALNEKHAPGVKWGVVTRDGNLVPVRL